jgi:hypothetical protein
MGSAALIVALLDGRQRIGRVLVGLAVAVAAAGILLTGWHSLSEIVASLFAAAGVVILVVATLARPLFRLGLLVSPAAVSGASVAVVAGVVGVRDGGAHRDLAAVTSAVVVVGAAAVAYAVMVSLLTAALHLPDEASPKLPLNAGGATAASLTADCRVVAAAGGHRRDWLGHLGSGLAGPSAPTAAALLAEADGQGIGPAAWLVMRRSLRTEGAAPPQELSPAAVPHIWAHMAALADRVAPPRDTAPAGALVRVLAETCRDTPANSLRALLAAATGAWRRAGWS